MAPLVVDPEALFAAGSAVVAAGDGLGAGLTVLTAGFAAHTGLDAAGMVFGLAYQDAAESLLRAAAAAINACRTSGALIQQGAANYSTAEAASTLGGGAGVLPAPAEPATMAAPGPPGTLGPGRPPPPLWALVQSFLDDVWPDGDVAGLRAAAGRWRGFGAAVNATPGTLNASRSLFDSQHLPEGGRIDEALSQLGTFIGSVGEQCGKLTATLDDFATEVEGAQNAIRDLLHRLGALTDLAHDVVLILRGDAIDEITKIAEDIEAVLHNLGREARAFEQGIRLGMQVVDGLVVQLEKSVRGRLTHFLGDAVGNQVATTFDFFVNANEGVLQDAVGMGLATADLDPRWFLVDPRGAADTWVGMTKGSPLDILLHPKEGAEANRQMWRSALHLDDWRSDRPGLGLGENVLDVATFFIPGAGEVGGAAEGASAAGRGAEAAGAAERAGGRAAGGLTGLAGGRGALTDIAKSARGLVDRLSGLTDKLPTLDPPASGRPVTLPPDKPPGKPLETPVEPAPRPAQPAPGTPHGSGDPTPPDDPRESPRAPADGPRHASPAPPGGVHGPADGAPPHARPNEPVPYDASPHEPNQGGEVDGPPADLTSDDLSALAHYTGIGYQDLNDALRSNAVDGSQRARIDALNQALEKLPPYDGPVVRGSNLPPDVLAQYRPGEFVIEKGFLSTTVNPAVAQSPAFAGNVEFRIFSCTGRDISALSMFPAEQEILFPSHTRFFVESKTLDPLTGRTIIEMVEE